MTSKELQTVDGSSDLNTHLIRHPITTFFMRASGDSMVSARIHPGDLLVVDRSLEAMDKKVIIAVVRGGLTIELLRLHGDRAFLEAKNEAYTPIEITKGMEFDGGRGDLCDSSLVSICICYLSSFYYRPGRTPPLRRSP